MISVRLRIKELIAHSEPWKVDYIMLVAADAVEEAKKRIDAGNIFGAWATCGYEHFTLRDVLAGEQNLRGLAKLIAQAAAVDRAPNDYHVGSCRCDHPSDDFRRFERLICYGNQPSNSQTLCLTGGALWTLGARYSSGPLLLALANRTREANSILLRAQALALPDVASELVEYAREMSCTARPSKLEFYKGSVFKLYEFPSTDEYLRMQPRWNELDMGAHYEEFAMRAIVRRRVHLSPESAAAIKDASAQFYAQPRRLIERFDRETSQIVNAGNVPADTAVSRGRLLPAAKGTSR